MSSYVFFDCKVDFLHRTVKDFLASPETRALFESWDPYGPDTDAIICGALLSQLKTAPSLLGEDHQISVSHLVDLFFSHCKALNNKDRVHDRRLPNDLLEDLDTTLRAFNKTDKFTHGCYHGILWTALLESQVARRCDMSMAEVDVANMTILHLSVLHGCNGYVERKLSCLPDRGSTNDLVLNLLQLAAVAAPTTQLLSSCYGRVPTPTNLCEVDLPGTLSFHNSTTSK